MVGAGARDEELLALRPAVEVPHKLGITVRGGGKRELLKRCLRRGEVGLACPEDLGDLPDRGLLKLPAEGVHVLGEPGDRARTVCGGAR